MTFSVAFEGMPSSGKSTAIGAVQTRLRSRGYTTEVVDIDSIGRAKELHTIAREYPFDHPARTLLYWVLRLQQYDFMRALEGEVDFVLADRFWESTYIFDVCRCGIPIEGWRWVGKYIEKRPDVTLYFDAPLEVTQQRKCVEIMGDPIFAQLAEQEYQKLASDRGWQKIDAVQEPLAVAEDCLKVIQHLSSCEL